MTNDTMYRDLSHLPVPPDIAACIAMLESVSGDDGYVIAKHIMGYTVRLRGAVGNGANLEAAIHDAIVIRDASEARLLDKELGQQRVPPEEEDEGDRERAYSCPC